MAVIKAVNSKAPIGTVIDYVEKKEKTDMMLMSGKDVSPETAKDEMQLTKELYGKTGGRTYKHFIQSFAPGEDITPQQAHEIACEFANRCDLLKDYEVLIVTHQDREHVHTHFVVNSVSMKDGHKFQMSAKDLQDMKDLSDSICRDHELSITEKGKTFEGQKRTEITAWNKEKYRLLTGEDKKVKPYVRTIGQAVKESADVASTKEEFIRILTEKDIKTDWQDSHKHITFTDQDGNKVRYKNVSQTFNLPFPSDRTGDEKTALEDHLKRNPINKAVESAYRLEEYRDAKESIDKFLSDNAGAVERAAAELKKDTITLKLTREETEDLEKELSECGRLQFAKRHELGERIAQNRTLIDSIKKHQKEVLSDAGCSNKGELLKKNDSIKEYRQMSADLGSMIRSEKKTMDSLTDKCRGINERDTSRAEEKLKADLGDRYDSRTFDRARQDISDRLDSEKQRITEQLRNHEREISENENDDREEVRHAHHISRG